MDKMHEQNERDLNKALRHLSAVYSRQERQLKAILSAVNEIIGEEAKTAYDAIKAAKNDDEKRDAKNKYLRLVRKAVAKDKRVLALISRAAEGAFTINQQAAEYANGYAVAVYARSFNEQSKGFRKIDKGFIVQEASEEDVRRVGAVADVQRVLNKRKDTAYTAANIKRGLIVGATLALPLSRIISRTAATTAKRNQTVAEEHAYTVFSWAENEGMIDAAERAAILGIESKKKWIATLDNRTRHSHALLDQKAIPLDGIFDNGLKFPRDTDGDPSEWVGCRCAMSIVGQEVAIDERAARRGSVSGRVTERESFAGTQSERVGNMSYVEWFETNGRGKGGD